MVLDFIIEEKNCPDSLSKAIIGNLFGNRLKNNKPTIVLIVGDSGEGKSYITLSLADILLQREGLDLKDYLKDTVIFTPLEYAEKMPALLHDKRLKKVKFLIMDEAREVVDAKKWFDYVTRAVAQVNTMFRRVKPMVIFVVTQYVGDIDKALRRTANFYGKCSRPQGQKTKLLLYRMWKDDKDVENPKLRKRTIRGVLKKEDGFNEKLYPIFRFNKPRPEIVELYEKLNYEAKSKIINSKMNNLLRRLKADLGEPMLRVNALVDFYVNKPEALHLILERKRGKMRLKKDFSRMQELTKEETAEFKKRLFDKLVERGIVFGEKKAVIHEEKPA